MSVVWFFLAQLLPLFVYPLGLSLVLLFLALWFRRRPRLLAGLLAAAIVVLWVGGNRWVATTLVRRLEGSSASIMPTRGAEVIVVLGGSGRRERAQVPAELSDRVSHALELYSRGLAPRILVSGGYLPWRESRVTEADQMASFLIGNGVPESAVSREVSSRNTRENAVHTWRLLEAEGVRRILLVTSAIHMRRAAAAFRKVGFEVEIAPTDFIVPDRRWRALRAASWPDQILFAFPSADQMALASVALKEYLGLAVYSARDWI